MIATTSRHRRLASVCSHPCMFCALVLLDLMVRWHDSKVRMFATIMLYCLTLLRDLKLVAMIPPCLSATDATMKTWALAGCNC